MIGRRARFWLVLLAVLIGLALALTWWVGRLLQPERLTPILLAQAQAALGLELTVAEPADVVLRPQPRLRLTGLTARAPGAPDVLLHVQQLDLALPWATLTGSDPVITHLRLNTPTLHLAALQEWLAQLPPRSEPLQIPTLTDGLKIEQGRIVGQGWAVDGLDLRLAQIALGEPLALSAEGRIEGLPAMPDAPADPAEPDEAGEPAETFPPVAWRLSLSGTLEDGPGLTGFRLNLDAGTALPALSAEGLIRLAEPFTIDATGQLAGWPTLLPALPAPLAESGSPLPFTLAWTGDPPMASPVRLNIARDEARFEGSFIPERIIAWWEAEPRALLPPAAGLLTAPELEIDGVRLEGVRIELDDDALPADPAAETPQP